MENTITDSLRVRKLEHRLTDGFPVRWCGGRAFDTAYYNALSMSFPAGEQAFIDSVHAAKAALKEPEKHRVLLRTLRLFCAQEATHRHVHAQYNDQLIAQGFINLMTPRVSARADRAKTHCVLNRLAVTVA